MPNRNEFGCPKLIYRIDSRPPEEIFNHGFRPWGSNNNFFHHILGYSLGDEIPEDRRSGIISASDSPDSSLRFFGGMLNNPFEGLQYYLYEIRADENVYSAQRTASFYQQRIRTGLINFEEGDLETAIDAVDSIYREFAYQREWFNVGPIPRERIRSAWRVDSVPINPIHIRHQQDTVYFTPRINDPEIRNDHYIDANTYANNLPYTEGATIQTTSRVSIPNELLESDASGGVGSSLGFACSLPRSERRDKRSIDKISCYFDKKLIHSDLKNKIYKPQILSDVFYSKVYLMTARTKEILMLSFKDVKNKNIAILENVKNINKVPSFIYDSFHCLNWKPSDKEYSYALTPVYSGFQNEYDISYAIAATNDESQKWIIEKVTNHNTDIDLFRIKSMKIKDFSIQRSIRDNTLHLRSINNHDSNYEEVYIVIGNNYCDTCILLPQNPPTKLLDIGLSWYYQNQNYVIIPESGWSKASIQLKNTFFYDINTYKILYINKAGKIFALYNKRKSNRWDWVNWANSNLSKTDDKRYMWYFQNDQWKIKDGINYRNIRSFQNNDYLRVIVSGSSWGGCYTINSPTDTNSIALFRIYKECDI